MWGLSADWGVQQQEAGRTAAAGGAVMGEQTTRQDPDESLTVKIQAPTQCPVQDTAGHEVTAGARRPRETFRHVLKVELCPVSHSYAERLTPGPQIGTLFGNGISVGMIR